MNEELDFDELAPWLVVFITLVGGALRVMLLDSKGMWLDETFSVWLADHSVADMLRWGVKIDQHPPLYYLLLHTWIAFRGDAPYHVRLLSALFGTGYNPHHLPDRQTHVGRDDRTGGSSDPGALTFQHPLRPRNAHVHPA